MRSKRIGAILALLALAGSFSSAAFSAQGQAEPRAERYLRAAERFAAAVLEHGRDVYGPRQSPLFVDGLHHRTFEPARWRKDGQTWVLCNFASQQSLMRLLDGLSAITADARYGQAAEEAAREALEHMQTDNGLLYWGGHLAWDLEGDRPVGQYADVHELKGHQPYYRLMHRVAPEATARLMAAIWAGHILDWARLDYNRHASVKKRLAEPWDHTFDEDVEVPFPSVGGNLSFCNVTPPLIHASTMLAVLDGSPEALLWTDRLARRWQQGKDPKTGLCGGQLSYREQDRAREALGHVHPAINEAKIVASYHQTSRYHDLPLVQMQAAEQLLAAGLGADLARKLIDWAGEDLGIYARRCYDPATGRFVARMTDGTELRWREAKTGYYVPTSFAPRDADGTLFWGYATAYRLTGAPEHLEMATEIGRRLGLWGAEGPAERAGQVACSDWQVIYPLLEMFRTTGDRRYLLLACRVGDNLIGMQSPSGLFPRKGYQYARTGDDIPLALIHLAAAISGKGDLLPRAVFDRRFFHCEYHGDLAEHQKKRADARTYDHLVFYGE